MRLGYSGFAGICQVIGSLQTGKDTVIESQELFKNASNSYAAIAIGCRFFATLQTAVLRWFVPILVKRLACFNHGISVFDDFAHHQDIDLLWMFALFYFLFKPRPPQFGS
ncbi:MAG: hypothetical protein ACFNX9_10050 [Eikenella corrodens]|uniref:hypothetical protein n=1 Tax=Eikenella corrodens TaxID=539 RepID=UPI003621685C